MLLVGIAYKKNVDDMRESPSLKLIELLERRGAQVEYYDPYIPVIPMTREHARLPVAGRSRLDPQAFAGFDAVLIATDHDNVDYSLVDELGRLVIDTRNACARAGLRATHIVKA